MVRLYLPVLALAAVSAFAAPFPRGCEVTGFSFTQNYLTLNESGQQTFYLLQNRSNRPIGIRRVEASDEFMTPSLDVALAPDAWAAFASDVQSMYFECFTQDADNQTLGSCRELLEICQYPRVRFALSNMGNYWVSANKSQQEVIKDAVAKGIYLRW